MRVTPKINDSPAPTKNRPDAAARPLSAWNATASRVIAATPFASPSPLVGEGWGGGSGGCVATVRYGTTPTPVPSPAEPRYSEGSAIQQSDRSRQQPTSVGGGEKRRIRSSTRTSVQESQLIVINRPHSAGRSFFTSASGGSTAAPSTYLKSTMMGLPSLSASLPT